MRNTLTMDRTEGKRPLGVIGGVFAAIVAVLSQGADDCARAGLRAGAASTDDVARPALVGLGTLPDDGARASGLGLGDDAARAGLPGTRTPRAGLGSRTAAEIVVEEAAEQALSETIHFAADFALGEADSTPSDEAVITGLVAMELDSVSGLEATLARSEPGATLLVTGTEVEGGSLVLAGGETREVRAVLGRCLMHQVHCAVLACRSDSGPSCTSQVSELARRAAPGKPGERRRDVLARLVELRDGQALGDVILYRATIVAGEAAVVASWYDPRS